MGAILRGNGQGLSFWWVYRQLSVMRGWLVLYLEGPAVLGPGLSERPEPGLGSLSKGRGAVLDTNPAPLLPTHRIKIECTGV